LFAIFSPFLRPVIALLLAITQVSLRLIPCPFPVSFFQRYPQHKQLHKKLAKYTDDDKMLESQAFENAALDIFNCIDEVMECSEDKVDFAIATLQRVGKVHGTIPGFSAEYFKVRGRGWGNVEGALGVRRWAWWPQRLVKLQDG
jgi:hypothetical protein